MTMILIVDDNEQNLYTLRILLEGHDYEVNSAGNGVVALEEARQNPPDIIISDILMPVMDGFALCREWKGDARLKEIPFIFYTATYTDPKDEDFALSLGAERFIVKPVEPQAFIGILQEVIRAHQAGQFITPREPVAQEDVYLKEYSEALIRKLEEKLLKFEAEIVERRQAEETLRESEARYRNLFDGIPVGLYRTKPEGTIIDANQTFVDLLGYPDRATLLLTDTHDLYVTPETRQRWQDIMAKEGVVLSFEERLRRYDGNTIWVASNDRAIRDDEGEVQYYEGSVEDITERKRIERESHLLHTLTQIAAKASDLQSALGRTLVGVCADTGWQYGEVWVPSQDGTVLECSPAFHDSSNRLEKFRQVTTGFTFSPDVGLPGRVWASRQAEWIRDVSAEPDIFFLRAVIAAESGLQAAMGVPIISQERVLAVLVFFMFESREEDKLLVNLVAAIATQLGIVLHRLQAEEELEKYRAHLEELVEVRTDELARTNEYLQGEILERELVEKELQEQTHKLRERVKELNCLYGIANLVEKPGLSLEEIYRESVDLIPPAWQYPEITCARLTIRDKEFISPGFRKTPWCQSHGVMVREDAIGTLEVCYLEEKPPSDEGPFLHEERLLINAITEQLGRVTEQVQAEAQLEREYFVTHTLAELSSTLINPAFSIEEAAKLTLDCAKLLTDSEHGYVLEIDLSTQDNVGYTITEIMGNECQIEGENRRISFPIGPDGRYPGLWGEALNTHEGFYTNSPDTHPASGGVPEGHLPLDNFLTVPVMLGDQLAGQFALANSEADYTSRDLNVITRLAGLYSLTLQRKRSEEAEHEQRTFAEALADTASILNSTPEIDEVLDLILANVERVVPHDAADIMLIDEDERSARIVRHKGYEADQIEEISDELSFQIDEAYNLRHMVEHKKPLAIPNVKDNPNWREVKGTEWIESIAGAPMFFGDVPIGFLNLVSAAPGFFKAADAEHLQAFANQASVAIRNTRLFEQARDLAALEERQRLARDMHDVVSQTLFTANLMAETLPRLMEYDPEEVVRGLSDLQRLTRGGLAEMRTLLLELRPEALVKADFGDLVRQLADSVAGRTQMDVSLNVEGQRSLPADVRTVFYRIAQECLNNIIKHSRAKKVAISLNNQPDRVSLQISDDGRGFDLGNVPPDRLGLSIMRERAEAIGADLKITSQVDQGTEVSLDWSG